MEVLHLISKKINLFLFMFSLFTLYSLSANTAEASTAITYKGTLPTYQNHTYRFSNLKEGIVSIDYISEEAGVGYSIDAVNQGSSYLEGDILPVGDYDLTFSPIDTTTKNYDIVLTGDLDIVGQTLLPTLNVTSPSTGYTRLNKGVFSVNYSGSTNSYIKNYVLNHNTPIALTSSFSKSLNLLFGQNDINTYVELTNKNSISDIREVVSPGVLRLSGSTRFQTAVEISKEIEKEGFDIETVIITNGYEFADGLPAVVLGHKEVAPILTTATDALPTEIKGEISRLGATKVIILGGSLAVSSNVETELRNMGLVIERISGIDRYEVSAKIASKVLDANSSSVIVVNGENYPDGLLAAPYAGNSGQPILYTRTDALPASIKTFLTNNPNINEFTIVGGTGAVSTAVEAELAKIGSVFRVSGPDRYSTGINIGYDLNFHKERIVFVSNEVDGVPAALLSSLKDSQLMLTRPLSIPSSIQDYIAMENYDDKYFFDNFYIVGGTGSVSTEVENYLNGAVN